MGSNGAGAVAGGTVPSFSAESVSEAQPDKVCDQVSECLSGRVPQLSRRAGGLRNRNEGNWVRVAGEITTLATVGSGGGACRCYGNWHRFCVDELSNVDSKGMSDIHASLCALTSRAPISQGAFMVEHPGWAAAVGRGRQAADPFHGNAHRLDIDRCANEWRALVAAARQTDTSHIVYLRRWPQLSR